MFKVISNVERVLSPVVVVLIGLEWLFTLPIKRGLLFPLLFWLVAPCVLALEIMLLYKIYGAREERMVDKIRFHFNVKKMNWVKAKLVILIIILISLVIIFLKYFNYPFTGEKKTIIFFSVLEVISIIQFFKCKKNIFIYENGETLADEGDETKNTTFYKIKYGGTKEDVKKAVEEFVHRYGYGLDGDKNGLFYSYFDFDSVCESCLSYNFYDTANVKIMCWIKYCGNEYNIHYKFKERKVRVFRSKEIKKIENLVRLIRNSYW